MRYFAFPFLMILSFTFWQASIYDINIQLTGSGQSISMYSFANKKILITTFNASNPDTVRLQFLDSLQTADTSLEIIAVPAMDSSGTGNDTLIANMRDSLALDFIIMKPARVAKLDGLAQHDLFKWLTSVTANGHFDADVSPAGKTFIINRKGVLYSVLENDAPVQILITEINREQVQ